MTDWVEGRVIRKRSWSDQLFSLEIEAPVAVFRAGQCVKVALDLDEKRIGRPYSLVNPPQQSPLEIYFNEVPQGPLSPRLSLLDADDRVWVGAQAGGVSSASRWCRCTPRAPSAGAARSASTAGSR